MLLVALQPVRLRQFSNAAAIVCESRQTQEDSINISDGAMPIVRILSVVWFFSFCCVSFADQIVLTNGDRLTGTIMKADDKTLVIKTEFAGDVTVQWPAVQEIHSTQTLHLVTRGEKTLVGTVTTADGNLAVGTTTSGTATVAKADVTALRNDEEQATYEKSLHPTLLHDWAGGANVGFALTRGIARPRIWRWRSQPTGGPSMTRLRCMRTQSMLRMMRQEPCQA